MRLYKTYILATLEKVLAHNLNVDDPELKDPGAPSVAPEDLPVFSEKTMGLIEQYRKHALLVEDFENWMALLENVAAMAGLNPATELDELASVLNRYRVDAGKQPL
jgi:hypothetical protein